MHQNLEQVFVKLDLLEHILHQEHQFVLIDLLAHILFLDLVVDRVVLLELIRYQETQAEQIELLVNTRQLQVPQAVQIVQLANIQLLVHHLD